MGQRDVFISYNSQDKDAALRLDEQLRMRGFQPWIDIRDAVPGQRWLDQLEWIIENAPAVLVLVGASGLGPWEAEEVAGALQQAVDRKVPVMPVFLEGTPSDAGPKSLPLFLRNRVAVDLRMTAGHSPLLALYAFDPRRHAVLLLGGNKAENKRFYRELVPRAEAIWEQYLEDTKE